MAEQAPPLGAPPQRERLTGVDAARGVALLGMMAVHVLPLAGFAGVVHAAAGGRASALFATLAGVGLALAYGGRTPPSGRELRRARRGVLARAAVVLVVGLTLGGVPTPAAVILAYYGVLFLVAVAVIGWPARRLAVAAVVCALGTPMLSHLLRLEWGARPGPNVSWSSLADPAGLLQTLLLTGYYPVLTWTTYLFAGLAVGRLDLRSRAVAARLTVLGAALAASSWLAAWLVVRAAGGESGLRDRLDPSSTIARRDDLLGESFYGTTPTADPVFLGVAAPHSGAIADLVHTTGTALLVLGVMLLVVPRAGSWVAPLVAIGSTTLTLYCLHVFLLGFGEALVRDPEAAAWPILAVNVAIAVVLATIWRSRGRRGPLENLAALAAAAATSGREPAGRQDPR